MDDCQIPHKSYKKHRFVFIAGPHRSGTSLVHRILREHPDISGFHDTGVPEDEGQHLQSVLPRNYPAGEFAMHKDSFMDESHPLVSEENAQHLFDDWSSYWDLSKSVLIEKTPQNIVRTRFLQALFQNSSYIVVLRHPLVVACATARMAKRTDIDVVLDNVLRAYECFDADRSHLRSYHIVRYENFVQNSSASVANIWEFLNVDSIPLSEHIDSQANTKHIKRWRSAFGWLERHRIAQQFEPRLNYFGYSIKHPCKMSSYS